MSGRPLLSGALPVWASDTLYPAGSNSWSGTPIKVNPGAGAISDGYTPKVPPGSQTDNYYQNLLSQFAVYLDCIDALNFTRLNASGLTYHLPAAHGRLVTWGAVDTGAGAGHYQYWLVGSDGGANIDAFYANNGGDFLSNNGSLPGTPVDFDCCDMNPSDGFLLGGEQAGASKYTLRPINGTWANLAMAGTTAGTYWIEHDRFVPKKFLAAGFAVPIATARPAIELVTEAANGLSATTVSMTVTSSATYTGQFRLLASSPFSAQRIALAKVSAPAARWEIWVNNDLTAAWSHVAIADPFASDPVAMTCSDDGTFMVTCVGGQVYTTVGGTTWTLKSTGDVWKPTCLASKGSAWLAVGTSNSIYYLSLSIDAGATWTRIAWPFPQDVLPIGVIVADGRFHVSAVKTTSYSAAQSLRTR